MKPVVKSMTVLLNIHPFQMEIKLSGTTENRHLRQALLQVVQAIEREGVSFNAFKIVPESTYKISNFRDPIWRAKHSHTVANTQHPGYLLRQKRLKLGLSGRAFARLLNVDPTHLSHVEHGRRVVSEKLRLRAESIFRTKSAVLEQLVRRDPALRNDSKFYPLGNVVIRGQTFFEDMQIDVKNLEELRLFFVNAED